MSAPARPSPGRAGPVRAPADLTPEPPMTLYVERTLDTRHVNWKTHQLNSNQRHGKAVYAATAVKVWRTTALSSFRRIPAVPANTTARVVVHFRFPRAHSKREAANYQPTVKAIVDGIVDAGVLADDSWPHCIAQDARELRPCNGVLEVVVQVWTSPR